MCKNRFQLKPVATLLALSIAALLPLVNASGQSLTAVNSTATKAPSKNSDLPKLITQIVKIGGDASIDGILAPIIGLDKPSAVKAKNASVGDKPQSVERRTCGVVMSDAVANASDSIARPKCLVLSLTKKSPGKMETLYYKVSLSGLLEKAVTIVGERDTDGKPIRGSGTKVYQDINSPETQKAFDAEMAYWLKDWLKKEQKAASTKKQAAVAKPAAAAAL